MFVGDVFDGLFFRPVVSSQAPTYAISAEQASSIAQDTAPRATIIEAAVITSYNGTSAYAVTLDTGEIYVDASTGRILLNTVSAAMSGGQDGQTD
jgi:uncharacterized membrane protein YkoI